MENPYQPPTANDEASPRVGGPFEAVLRVATLQRHLNIAVLPNLCISSLLGGSGGEIPILLLLLAAVATIIFSVVTSVRIAHTLYGKNQAIVCGGLMFVPIANLITLLVLSSGATKRLREEGIKVGFLGASPAAVRARIEEARTECVHCAMQIREERSAVLCKVCRRLVHRDCLDAHHAHVHAKSSPLPGSKKVEDHVEANG